MPRSVITTTNLGAIVAMFDEESSGSVELLEGDPNTITKHVQLLKDINEFDSMRPDTLVILDPELSAVASGYILDVLVRRALSARVSGIAVISNAPEQISSTGRLMCRSSGLGLLRLNRANDINKILHGVAIQLVDDIYLALNRAQRACEAIDSFESTDPIDLADTVGDLLGWQIDVGPAPDPGDESVLSSPVITSEPDGSHFVIPHPQRADTATLVRLMLARMSLYATARTLVERNQLVSVNEVLLQLISGDSESRDELPTLAQRLGIPISSWHSVLHFEFTNQNGQANRLGFETRERLARIALASARALGGTWHVAQDAATLYLNYSTKDPSPVALGPWLERSSTAILAALQRSMPDIHFHIGIGSARKGVTGLSGSSTEASLAATHARSTRRMDTPVSFDAVGLRTTVVEWYGSPTVRKSIDSLFEPLKGLPKSRYQSTVEILGTYLDCGGSIARTSEAMHLHRNAVRERLKRAVALLDVDLDDPDQRLFVHLACRSKSLLLLPGG